MKSILKSYNKGYVFSSFAVLSFVLSVIYKYVVFYQGIHLKYTWITDFILLSIAVLVLLKKNRALFILLLLLVFLKIFGTLSILDKFPNTVTVYKEIIKTSIVYSAIPILVFYTRTFTYLELKFFFKIFKIITVVICLSILLGTLLNVYMLETYTGKRFGFSGVLYPSSFSSYFIITSILILFYYNKHIEKVPLIYLTLLIFSALFVGTKSIYFFLLIFFLVVFIEEKLYKKKLTWLSVIGLFIIFISLQKVLFKTFSEKFDVLIKLYQESDITTFILSYRNYSFNSAKLYINENWNLINFLIGGVNRKSLLVEMGLIDIGLSFGILGISIFILIYYKCIFNKMVLSVNMLILLGALMLIILLSGNFFKSITLAYFVSYLFLLISRPTNDTNLKH
jgi:hypothetical protein